MRTLVHPDDRYTTVEPFVPEEQRHVSPFCVYRRGVCTDTVYFPSERTSDEVRQTLIHRDGFPMDILVQRGAK